MAKLETITVGGVDIDVFIKTGGIFTARFRDIEYEAPSLEQLKRQLQAAGKIKLEIPFTSVHEGDRWASRSEKKPHVKHGIAIGRHAGNRNVLVRYEGAKSSEQNSGYGGHDVRRLTEPEIAEWVDICTQIATLEARKETWLKERKVDLRRLVDEALQAAAGEPAADPPSKRGRRR